MDAHRHTPLTVTEIHHYVTAKVTQWAQQRQVSMRPAMEFKGRGDLVLASTEFTGRILQAEFLPELACAVADMQYASAEVLLASSARWAARLCRPRQGIAACAQADPGSSHTQSGELGHRRSWHWQNQLFQSDQVPTARRARPDRPDSERTFATFMPFRLSQAHSRPGMTLPLNFAGELPSASNLPAQTTRASRANWNSAN